MVCKLIITVSEVVVEHSLLTCIHGACSVVTHSDETPFSRMSSLNLVDTNSIFPRTLDFDLIDILDHIISSAFL